MKNGFLLLAVGLAAGCSGKRPTPQGALDAGLDAGTNAGASCAAGGAACPSGQQCVAGTCRCPAATPDACGTGASAFCTSLRTDSRNCGSCGTVCPDGELCNGSGVCASSCVTGDVACSGVLCADTQTDPENCGRCGDVCDPGASCVDGACTCPPGQKDCNGAADCPGGNCGGPSACTNEREDPNHCAACATACTGETPYCAAGVCQANCAGAGNRICGKLCADLTTDSANCGACGNACDPGASCVSGTCSCPPGQTDCNGAAPCAGGNCGGASACTDEREDPNHCGACGIACTGSMPYCNAGLCQASCAATGNEICGGLCVDVNTDNANCGGCGKACAPGQKCDGTGRCAGSAAGDGGPGAACTSNDACQNGICGNGFCCATSCLTFGMCGATACDATGACVYPTQQCVAATCNLDAGTETEAASCAAGICPAAVTRPCAPYACGPTACKTACATSSDCVSCHDCTGGQCVAADLQTDPANCGTCGHACPAGAACVSGACGCAIAGSPYADGGLAPGNACVYCNVLANTTGWTMVADGTACDGGWGCEQGACATCPTNASLDEAGTCACDIGTTLSDAGACVLGQWANWPMPNPADAGLPNPARYDTSTAGVVTDEVTDLMWQQPLGALAGGETWAGAAAYCSDLALAGHSDWRLPTVMELRSLVDFTLPWPGPTIDTTAFPGTPGAYFWSATLNAGDSSKAWYVRFSDGDSWDDGDVATAHQLLRCVRATAAPRSGPRYDVSDAGTVADNETGLVWQQPLGNNLGNGGYMTWNEAQSYCTALALAGGGWRVPSVNELLTLVDFTVASLGPTIDTTAFPNTPNTWFWTSSLLAGNPSDAWGVYFDYGFAYNGVVGLAGQVRCVR